MKLYKLNKTNTQTQAIRAKCTDCIYDPLAMGGVLVQITKCTSTDCALWEWRPLNSETKAIAKEEKISLMTPEQKTAYYAKADIARDRLANLRLGETQ